MEDRNLSLSAVAGTLGVSERTVRRWIQSGKLRAYKPGRDYRIPESALTELVEESEISPKGLSSSPEPSFNDVLDDERRAAIGGLLGSWVGMYDESVSRWSRAIEREPAFESADAAAAFCAEVIAEGAVGQTIIKRYLIPQAEILLPGDEAARERQDLLETHSHLGDAMSAVLGVVEGMVDSGRDVDAASKAIGRYLDRAVTRAIDATREERHDRPDLELWLARERKRRREAGAQTRPQPGKGSQKRPTA